jgi:hypothetical protein
MSRLRRRGFVLFSASVMGLALAGGIAYATIPDSERVIHSCFKPSDATKPGGAALSVIDSDSGATCKPGETALTFNQQGPPGPQGPQGDPGPSDAYVVTSPGAPLTQDWGSVAHIDLPYGKYVVTAMVSLWNAAFETSPIYVTCEIDAPNSGGNVGTALTEIPSVVYSQASLALVGSMPYGGPADVDCRATVGFGTTVSPSDAISQFVTLNAIKVRDIH